MIKVNLLIGFSAYQPLHCLITSLFFALPLIYIQLLIGQYTQLGVTCIKYLVPIAHGVHYILSLITIVNAYLMGTDMADFFMYFLNCMQANMQWMYCPPDSEDRCWGAEYAGDCNETCIKPNMHLSAYIFWK